MAVDPLKGTTGETILRLVAQNEDRLKNSDLQRLARGSRAKSGFTPMIITTDYRVSLEAEDEGSSRNRRHLLFWSGPRNTTWNFNQRGSMQQSRSGHIAHFWRDSKRSTFFDNPSVSFTFQTGSLLPIRQPHSRLNAINASAFAADPLPPGLLDYYEFFNLLDERKILSDGRPNFVNIIYHSLLYPTILLRGFFEPETAINVNEEAGKPASVEWNATFRIKESTPTFNESSKLVEAWHEATYPQNNNLVEQVLKSESVAERRFVHDRANSIFEAGGAQIEELEETAKVKAELTAAANRKEQRKLIDFVDGDSDFGAVFPEEEE